MLLGAMNHPMRDLYDQIAWFRDNGFDFIDLTLEPAQALAESLDVHRLRQTLTTAGLQAVGHTAWYLPIASPYDGVRQAAVRELRRCLEVCAELGIRRIAIHPDSRVSLFDQEWVLARNVESLTELAAMARELGVRLLLENMPGQFSRADRLKMVFRAVPELGFLLDVGHANLHTTHNVTKELLANLADRLEHVHLSDNKGGEFDLHLPLGAGTIDWPEVVALLKRHSYDGTITLEVFSPDLEYLIISGRKLRKLWAGDI